MNKFAWFSCICMLSVLTVSTVIAILGVVFIQHTSGRVVELSIGNNVTITLSPEQDNDEQIELLRQVSRALGLSND